MTGVCMAWHAHGRGRVWQGGGRAWQVRGRAWPGMGMYGRVGVWHGMGGYGYSRAGQGNAG